MEEKKELPNRKHPRLDNYDYSSAGAYFITICTQNRKCVLSRLVGRGLAPAGVTNLDEAFHVGRGLAPAEENTSNEYQIKYTKYGQIAEKQLFALESRYPYMKIDQYVIMPNHIHVLMIFEEAAGASPCPTLMDIVCAYKSLTTRECRQYGFKDKLFQTSFFEHIIRNRQDYEEHMKYIYENPMRWYYDELYTNE